MAYIEVKLAEGFFGVWHVGGRPYRGARDLLMTLHRAREAYEATLGFPTTRKDLAAASPTGAPAGTVGPVSPPGAKVDL